VSLQIISHCEHFQLSLSIFSAMHICIDVCCFFSIHFVLLCCGLLLRMEWYSVGLICVHIISRRETTGRTEFSDSCWRCSVATFMHSTTLERQSTNKFTKLQFIHVWHNGDTQRATRTKQQRSWTEHHLANVNVLHESYHQ